jgi:hypothetical protein
MILDRTEENWIQSKCHRTDIFIGLLEHTQPYKDSPTLEKIRLKICKQQCKQTIGNYFHTDRQTAGMKRNCRGQDICMRHAFQNCVPKNRERAPSKKRIESWNKRLWMILWTELNWDKLPKSDPRANQRSSGESRKRDPKINKWCGR